MNLLKNRSGLIAPTIAAVGMILLTAHTANAGFVAYEIRNSPTIIPGTPLEIIIDAPGEKAALGSNDINGKTLGSISKLKIERVDINTRFPSGSGPRFAPYLNFWITDGMGNYAVVANEPTNTAFQPLYSNGYDLTFADLSDKVAKIYENSDLSWLPNSGVGLTFDDLKDFVIQAPSVAELTTGWSGLGTGAPREDVTLIAYGVNWVFGDTLANYLSGDDPGYLVQNAMVMAVPAPATLALLGFGLAGLGVVRRKAA